MQARKKCALLLIASMLLFAMAAYGQAAKAPAATSIPHGKLNIKYPAIIDVDETIFANKKYKIGYANWNDENSISIIVRDSIVDACKYYGVELMIFDNKQDPNRAMSNADTAILAGVDYYLNFNQDESINAAIAQKLANNGIPMISIQTKARNNIDPEYHVDNERAGSICGELLVAAALKMWPGQKPVLFIAGHPQAGVNFIIRANSAIAAVKKAMPDVKVFETSTEGSPEVTRQRTADFLTANPKGKIMMWNHIDQNTLGMLAAVKAAGRESDVIITSFGANPVIFPELKNPKSPVIGTVAQFSERFGWDLLPLVLKHLNDGVKPPLVTLPPLDIITKDNLSKYYPGM
ncbi:MAG TPA: sugar ABC transporter substrate-binding protein [Rectinemataceae bacterium]|nr:sugar ABC transporter substrate-binding protein [Rectinemataceae bacterium]